MTRTLLFLTLLLASACGSAPAESVGTSASGWSGSSCGGWSGKPCPPWWTVTLDHNGTTYGCRALTPDELDSTLRKDPPDATH